MYIVRRYIRVSAIDYRSSSEQGSSGSGAIIGSEVDIDMDVDVDGSAPMC